MSFLISDFSDGFSEGDHRKNSSDGLWKILLGRLWKGRGLSWLPLTVAAVLVVGDQRKDRRGEIAHGPDARAAAAAGG
jgi:hypothetical protein